MNERIKELMGQTLDSKFSYTWTTMDYKDIEKFSEKFAELIVKECIDCVRGAGLTDEVAVKNNLRFNDGLSAAVVNVQKHFGVEQ